MKRQKLQENKMKVKIKFIDGGKLPEYKTEGAVCADCYARLSAPFISIPKGKRCLVNLGFAIELPVGYEAVIRPRSGLSKTGIDVSIGTIDWDYRGEVKACVINNTDGDFDIHNEDRICQIKIQKAEQFEFEKVDELSETKRGEGGFGSTGSM
jgi:dUTP pyrophosphatase